MQLYHWMQFSLGISCLFPVSQAWSWQMFCLLYYRQAQLHANLPNFNLTGANFFYDTRCNNECSICNLHAALCDDLAKHLWFLHLYSKKNFWPPWGVCTNYVSMSFVLGSYDTLFWNAFRPLYTTLFRYNNPHTMPSQAVCGDRNDISHICTYGHHAVRKRVLRQFISQIIQKLYLYLFIKFYFRVIFM